MDRICAVLECAPWAYWAAKKREAEPSARAVRDEQLRKEIVRVWGGPGRRVYGVRKVWTHLNREGIMVARCVVERLMRELGIAGVCASRKRPRTTAGGAEWPGELLECGFTADAPDRRWVADVTCVDTAAGWVYAAFVQGLFSRAIVGWQIADHLGAELALDALDMAIWSRGGSDDGLVHHGGRGVRYTASRYAERLGQLGAARPVGGKGDSFDNAAAESLNGPCQKELIDVHGGWENVMDVTLATMEWVARYDTERMHSYCGNIPPREYEEAFHLSHGTATRAG